jgi:hypothetical protein
MVHHDSTKAITRKHQIYIICLSYSKKIICGYFALNNLDREKNGDKISQLVNKFNWGIFFHL